MSYWVYASNQVLSFRVAILGAVNLLQVCPDFSNTRAQVAPTLGRCTWIERRGLFENKIPGVEQGSPEEMKSREEMKGWEWLWILIGPRGYDGFELLSNAEGQQVWAKVYIMKKKKWEAWV